MHVCFSDFSLVFYVIIQLLAVTHNEDVLFIKNPLNPIIKNKDRETFSLMFCVLRCM